MVKSYGSFDQKNFSWNYIAQEEIMIAPADTTL